MLKVPRTCFDETAKMHLEVYASVKGVVLESRALRCGNRRLRRGRQPAMMTSSQLH